MGNTGSHYQPFATGQRPPRNNVTASRPSSPTLHPHSLSQEGNSPLHVCKTVELATALLEGGAKPYKRGKGAQVKTPYELQNTDIRDAIDEFTHFCDPV